VPQETVPYQWHEQPCIPGSPHRAHCWRRSVFGNIRCPGPRPGRASTGLMCIPKECLHHHTHAPHTRPQGESAPPPGHNRGQKKKNCSVGKRQRTRRGQHCDPSVRCRKRNAARVRRAPRSAPGNKQTDSAKCLIQAQGKGLGTARERGGGCRKAGMGGGLTRESRRCFPGLWPSPSRRGGPMLQCAPPLLPCCPWCRPGEPLGVRGFLRRGAKPLSPVVPLARHQQGFCCSCTAQTSRGEQHNKEEALSAVCFPEGHLLK